MSYQQPSYNADYDHQGGWFDGNVGQDYPGHPASLWASNAHNNQSDATVYANVYSSGRPGSQDIVDSKVVWTSRGNYRAAVASEQHVYASQRVHMPYGNGVHGRYRENHIGHNVHDASPAVAEYGHHSDVATCPIEEHHQYQYGNQGYESPQPGAYYREWATDSQAVHQVATTDASDEYRASIARCCDAIHATGSHGLESDIDAPHISVFQRHLSREEVKREPSPIEYSPHNELHNEIAAAAAYNTLVSYSHTDHVTVPLTDDIEPLIEPPMRVPSQQHLVDYMHDQLSENQSFPVANYEPNQGSVTNHLPPPPDNDADLILRTGLPFREPSPTANFSPCCQGLEHEATGSEGELPPSPSPSPPPTSYPGSSQSVLKLTTTKKVAEKKQALACLFCRERKIACGRPDPESEDQTCNQCARRHLHCRYPTESRRGQHKRIRRKKTHDHDVNESSPLNGY